MDVLASTRHNIQQYGMVSAGDRVVVAVSGGPDSLCLLHVLTRLRAELAIELHVAHLNHGLRGEEAAADAAYVADVAKAWDIAYTIDTADVQAYRKSRHLSLEEAARQVRYRFLQQVATQCGAAAIAVGHTADDQVETILMHLLRGAGPTGLRGMLPVQPWPGGVPLIRPLLDVSRHDIEEYCIAQGLTPRRDRSNEDERIWRNRVRRKLLPLLEEIGPHVRRSLLRTARILADEDAYLEEQVRSVWERAVTVSNGAVQVDLAAWQTLPVVLQRRLLRAVWQQAAQTHNDLSWVHVEHARAVIAGHPGAMLSLPQGTHLYRGYTYFAVTGPGSLPERPPNMPLLTVDQLELTIPGTTELPELPWTAESVIMDGASQPQAHPPLSEDFDADAVGTRLFLRPRRAGDRMQPLGMAESKKVHDIMIDARVPRLWRDRVPLLVTADDRIAWIVGVRRSEWSKVQAHTQRILRVTFRCTNASKSSRSNG